MTFPGWGCCQPSAGSRAGNGDVTPASPPEPLVEAARDLLVICGALNQPSPAARIFETPDGGRAEQVGWAYSAVAEAFELADGVQLDPSRYGLDGVVAALVALMLRRLARDLEAETDRWHKS